MVEQNQNQEENDTGRVFLEPLTIYYYKVINCEFEKHPENGCLMPIESVDVDTMLLRNNRELFDFWVRKDDWEYPIPLDLQLFMGTADMLGLYEDSMDELEDLRNAD